MDIVQLKRAGLYHFRKGHNAKIKVDETREANFIGKLEALGFGSGRTGCKRMTSPC